MAFWSFIFRKKYPIILPRKEHNFSTGHVEKGVLDTMYRLRRNGYDAYLVGGCVRDILLGRTPKDFDIVTDARPRQIKRIFSRCFLIGRRFRLAHVFYHPDHFVEVATFRALIDPVEAPEDRDDRFAENNTFGSIEEDALRRDFTVNALYYNIADSTIVDHVGGLRDIGTRTLRSIGDPCTRYQDDPVRMIRAARFCATLGLTPARGDRAALRQCAHLIAGANASRMLEEIYKILRCGAAAGTFANLVSFGMVPHIMAELNPKNLHGPIMARLEALDARRAAGEDIPNNVLLTTLFYDLFADRRPLGEDMPNVHDEAHRIGEEFGEMSRRLRIPRAEWDRMCQTIARQAMLSQIPDPLKRRRSRGSPVNNAYFRDALLFFSIRAAAEGRYANELRYWKERAAATPQHHRPAPGPAHRGPAGPGGREQEAADTHGRAAGPHAHTPAETAGGEEAPKKKRRRRKRGGRKRGGEGGGTPAGESSANA